MDRDSGARARSRGWQGEASSTGGGSVGAGGFEGGATGQGSVAEGGLKVGLT